MKKALKKKIAALALLFVILLPACLPPSLSHGLPLPLTPLEKKTKINTEKPYPLPPPGYRHDFSLKVPMTIHIIAVGTEKGVIRPEVILPHLPKEYSPMDTKRSMVFKEFHEPITYNYEYVFHEAPAWFAEDLFAFANSNARWDKATDYLKDYDEKEQHRLDDSDLIQYVNVTAVEKWIEEHKEKAGLDFEKPSYSIFLLDSYSRKLMPTDTYHYYEFREDRRGTPATKTMRAWGGNFDFLILDLSAAPNDDEPRYVLLPGDTAESDPPIWDYEPSEYDSLNEHIATDIAYGIYFRITPSYLYHPQYAPVYYMNVHFFIEDGALIEGGPESKFDMKDFLERLQYSVPWAKVTGSIKTYHLPDDDPGMNKALQEGKERGKERYVDPKPVANYVERNKEKYLTGPKNSFQVFVGIYLFKYHWGFAAPMIVGGIAYDKPDGRAWGVLLSNNDWVRRGNAPRGFTDIAVHEVSHFWGYPHPHDGMIINDKGEYTLWVDSLWDQSATIMSYRVVPYSVDEMHRQFLARGVVAANGPDILRNLDVAYSEARKKGVEVFIGEDARLAKTAEEKLLLSKKLIEEGKEYEGVDASLQALNASLSLRKKWEPPWSVKVISWDKEVTTLTDERVRAGGISYVINQYTDYRRIPVEENMEAIRITVSWENTETSYGDLFVGYSFTKGETGAVFDIEQDVHSQRKNAETLYLDMDDDGFREWGYLYLGAGTNKAAVNCDYHVKVEIFYRE